ncbi:hypothetical protein Gorai_002048 [Gossypium raimondii]|uniref:Uncharacterized protein n=1 Tax=Gossypium raimondii TaxID=29730 RepID=A0A7J8QQB9_GOSRA|nr:hypothetical protein [Gossypium raimondii]
MEVRGTKISGCKTNTLLNECKCKDVRECLVRSCFLESKIIHPNPTSIITKWVSGCELTVPHIEIWVQSCGRHSSKLLQRRLFGKGGTGEGAGSKLEGPQPQKSPNMNTF